MHKPKAAKYKYPSRRKRWWVVMVVGFLIDQFEHLLMLERSATAAIGRHTLIGQPQPLGRWRRLPKHVDGDAAMWIPVAANAQPSGFQFLDQPLADTHRAVLVEGAVI